MRIYSLYSVNGDGDFRSPECAALLKESDIVVTNPPFSIFNEYMDQLVAYNKKFLIIGNQNAIAYKGTFKLMADNKVWCGHSEGGMGFDTPGHKGYPLSINMRDTCWYTNLGGNGKKGHGLLGRAYNENDYPKYDNYDAINVNRCCDIPIDYDGEMGVPITYMLRHDPGHFEIIGLDLHLANHKGERKRFSINGNYKYARIVVRNKKPTATA